MIMMNVYNNNNKEETLVKDLPYVHTTKLTRQKPRVVSGMQK